MSNEIRTFLAPDNVIVGLDVSCKRSVLKHLAAHAARTLGIDETGLMDTLLEREQLGSTGIGRGVAVPHGRADVPRLSGVFARLARPVDFDSIDDKPVDLVFLLIAPPTESAAHLKALSRVARLLRSDTVQRAMRGTSDAAALYALATGEADAEAA